MQGDLDREFLDLFRHATDEGSISTGDLEEFREFIKFQNWKTANKE